MDRQIVEVVEVVREFELGWRSNLSNWRCCWRDHGTGFLSKTYFRPHHIGTYIHLYSLYFKPLYGGRPQTAKCPNLNFTCRLQQQLSTTFRETHKAKIWILLWLFLRFFIHFFGTLFSPKLSLLSPLSPSLCLRCACKGVPLSTVHAGCMYVCHVCHASINEMYVCMLVCTCMY